MVALGLHCTCPVWCSRASEVLPTLLSPRKMTLKRNSWTTSNQFPSTYMAQRKGGDCKEVRQPHIITQRSYQLSYIPTLHIT